MKFPLLQILMIKIINYKLEDSSLLQNEDKKEEDNKNGR